MSARTANERDRSAGKAPEDPRGCLVPDGRGELAGAAHDALRAACREVSTGTN
jgi:hypothetical protein